MPLTQLSVDSLKHLDEGKTVALLEMHLKRAAEDCEDRPNDPKARVVTLQFELSPQCDEQGDLEQVRLQVQAASKVPTHKTRAYSCAVRRGGMIVFNRDSPGNVNQETLLPDDES